ncbi:hypothetical protein QUF54_07365, partial [Candidatus Marithioploca araucensis]|nr:hypothetical protein [Candidatus Marithioploca araucensis]
LENTAGEPLDATVNMTFALYAAAQGGSASWTETHQNVEVTDGVFSLILGNTTSFDDDSLEGERYLGVTVGSDPEMAPRQQLTSAFFAMRAGVADSVKAASVETEAIADGAVTADKIAPQTITGDRIADGVTITAEERQKLVDLGTGGVGSEPTFENVVVEEQLNVKRRIKVGENSLYLGGSTVGTGNEIWTDGAGTSEHLVIQPPAKSDKNVGIGTNDPKGKLDIAGTLKVVQGIINGDTFKAYNEKGLFFNYLDGWGDVAVLKQNTFPFDDGKLGFAGLEISGDPLVLNAYTDPNRPDKQFFEGTGNVGVGTKTPKNKLDVAGSVAIGSGYAGKETALPNGLIVEDTVSIGYGESDLESDGSYLPGEKHKSPPSGLVVKGKVGIGTSKPQHELHLDIENAKIAFGDNNTFERANQYGAANVLVGEYGKGDTDQLQLHGKKGIYFTTGNYQGGHYRLAMRIDKNGHVGVNGKLSAKEIEVKLEDWSDYVFDEDYELMPLNEVESYINANKHLPDVPSADEVTENGLNLGETDALLLRKIEELTLYMIEQNKRIEKLERENEDLKQMLSK